MKKFIQVPVEIQNDVIDGKLIGNDLLIYNYLVIKAGHGKPIYYSNEKIGEDLGGMSYGKISASLNRLMKAKHIKRRKTCNKTETQLRTVIRDSNNILIRGQKK
jgi:hypothetical protein